VARTPIRLCLCSPNALNHLPQKMQISLKMCSLWDPHFPNFGYLFRGFLQQVAQGLQGPPQSGNKIGKWTPWVPKCNARVPKCSPKVTQITSLCLIWKHFMVPEAPRSTQIHKKPPTCTRRVTKEPLGAATVHPLDCCNGHTN